MCGTPLQMRDHMRGPTSGASVRLKRTSCGPSPCEYPFVRPLPVRVGDMNQASGHPAIQLRRRIPSNQE